MTIKITKAQINQMCTSIDDAQIAAVKQVVMFVGHAHSGHSLVGALLDGHPQAAISNHVNIPKLLVDHSLNKDQLLKVLLCHALQNNGDEAWINTGYSYQIQQGHQGSVTHPTVLGDKQGGASTRILMMHPEVMSQLLDMFGERLSLIFVHRNPFDNIAAFAHYMDEELSGKPTERYFENLQTTLDLKKRLPAQQWFQLSHEQFIEAPQHHLMKLFNHFGLHHDPDMVKNLTDIVNTTPHQRRKSVQWPEALVDHINDKMQSYPL